MQRKRNIQKNVKERDSHEKRKEMEETSIGICRQRIGICRQIKDGYKQKDEQNGQRGDQVQRNKEGVGGRKEEEIVTINKYEHKYLPRLQPGYT